MKDAEEFIEQIEEMAREWDVSAVVAVRDREGFRYERAFGWADREEGRLMTVSDRFCLDAETGFFLTLCVMDLAERRALRLSDRLSRFIPEYKHAERITVNNLLRWRTGIEDYWRALTLPELQNDPAHAGLDDRERFIREYELYAGDRDFGDILRVLGDRELKRAPGIEDDGSASTIPFLSELIRRASGMTALEYLFRRFFEPLGMSDTRPGNDSTTALYGMLRDEEPVRLPRISPKTCFTTTARDMLRLAEALAEKKLFSPATWKVMLKCVDDTALGFLRTGELYVADFYLHKLRNVCQLELGFEDGTAILALHSEEPRLRRDEMRHWRSFTSDLRRAWQDSRVYPKDPELKRVNGKNVWDVMDIELKPEQLNFVPECSRCVAVTVAQKQPVYVLMDHALPVGIAALSVEPRKNEYSVAFLQVDRRYQGRGYGRILLTRAIEILRDKGATTLEIGVNRFNTAARRLYRSVGFEDSEVYDDFVEMKMDLPPRDRA